MGFKAEDHEAPSFEPIPKSWQPMILVEAKKKQTKAQTGYYINACFKVIEGEYAGRMIWSIFNLDNPNEKATEISKSQLANLMKAMDVDEIDDMWDWQPLFSIPFAGSIKVVPAKGDWDAKNDVAKFATLDDQDVDSGGDDWDGVGEPF